MRIDFSYELKNIDGTAIMAGQEGTALKLKKIAVDALMGSYPDEQNLGGEEKVRRYDLATKIYSMTDPDMTVEDVALIKKLVGKAYTALVVGQAWKVLEGVL